MDESIILQKAIEVIKDDIDIWDRLLKIYLENDHFELAIHNLLTAVKELKDDSLPLWKMMIKYMHNTNPRFVCIFQYDTFYMILLPTKEYF